MLNNEFVKWLNTNEYSSETILGCFKFLASYHRKITIEEVKPWFFESSHKAIEDVFITLEETEPYTADASAIDYIEDLYWIWTYSQDYEVTLPAETFQLIIDVETYLNVLQDEILETRRRFKDLKNSVNCKHESQLPMEF